MTGLLARWRRRRLQRRLLAPRLLAAFADRYPAARFVQIGANDGEQHDQLRPFIRASAWTGVMVEPVPFIFTRLQRNYGSLERVALENSAVAASAGTAPFFHVREADAAERARLPDWYDGIGSFSHGFLLGHAEQIPDIADRIVSIDVPVLTFDSLCAKHGLTDVDLVLVDAEGHDGQIIRSIDLATHRPRLLIYEHFHLDRDERAACGAHLHAAGYEAKEEGFDTFALRTEEDDELTRAWRALTPGVAGVYAGERGP